MPFFWYKAESFATCHATSRLLDSKIVGLSLQAMPLRTWQALQLRWMPDTSAAQKVPSAPFHRQLHHSTVGAGNVIYMSNLQVQNSGLIGVVGKMRCVTNLPPCWLRTLTSSCTHPQQGGHMWLVSPERLVWSAARAENERWPVGAGCGGPAAFGAPSTSLCA